MLGTFLEGNLSTLSYFKHSEHFQLCALRPIETNSRYVDLDPMFSAANDEDFDINLMAIF